MIDRDVEDLQHGARNAAELAIARCARELLSVAVVTAHVIEEWRTQAAQAQDQQMPTQELLNRIALRYCSRRLYLACCSLDPDTRNCAFENLERYLKHSLACSRYAQSLAEHANASEDVVQQTLAELHRLISLHPAKGPDDPAAFLKWAQTILIHNAHNLLESRKREMSISLDAQTEAFLDAHVEGEYIDHSVIIEAKELQEIIKHAMLSLRNPRYRLVLAGTFLAELDEAELASIMGVQIQDIYLWRHRALKALRSNREVVEALRQWLR